MEGIDFLGFVFRNFEIKIMKKYLYLLLFTAAASSQSFQWLNVPPINLSLNPGMVGCSSTVDAGGNTYASGFQDNPYSYGTIFGDVFFNKYDQAGQPGFSKTFTGRVTVYDMAADSEGNIVVAIGYVNFALIEQGSAFNQYRYCKYRWPQLSRCREWRSRFCGKHARIVDTDGNIYAAGSCAEFNANFADVSAPTNLNYNTWIVKYSPDGTYQWVRYIEDITCPHPKVKSDTPQHIYFSSDLYGAYQFGSITAGGPSNNFNGDFFLAKLNADGNFQWVRGLTGMMTLQPMHRVSAAMRSYSSTTRKVCY